MPRAAATSAGTFFDPVRSGNLGYVGYRFSYHSTHPEAHGGRVVFDGIGRYELDGDTIRRYSEIFDRGMALAQQAYAPERLSKDPPQIRRRDQGAT